MIATLVINHPEMKPLLPEMPGEPGEGPLRPQTVVWRRLIRGPAQEALLRARRVPSAPFSRPKMAPWRRFRLTVAWDAEKMRRGREALHAER